MLDDDDIFDDFFNDEPDHKKNKKSASSNNQGTKLELTEDVMRQITRSVEEDIEDRLQLRIKKSLTVIRFALIIVFLVLAPAAWFSVKNLIQTSVDTVNKDLYDNIGKISKEMQGQVESIKHTVDNQLLYLKLSHDAEALKQRVDISPVEVMQLMGDLREIAKAPILSSEKSFSVILESIVSALLNYGYEEQIEELTALFPTVMRYSQAINEKIFIYYGRKVLSAVDVDSIKDSTDLKRFQSYRRMLELGKAEVNTLPMEILVQFHIAGDERNPLITNLINSVVNLRFNERTTVLWNVIRHTNPLFWEHNPLPGDFRIAKIANKFTQLYQAELLDLANGNGVKETMLNMYEYANTTEDLRLGKFIIYYFYKIPVD